MLPGASTASGTDEAVTITAGALRRHVEQLTARGPRHRDNPAAVRAAVGYVADAFAQWGYSVTLDQYGAAPDEVTVLADVPTPRPGPIVEVGAHWDSVAGSPGADDNAGGVAGLLELARHFAEAGQPGRTLRFCAFGGEEDAPGGSRAGSRAHVASLAAGGPPVEGAIVLEMIAYRDPRPGSQSFPADLAAAAEGHDRGDFIAAVGNPAAADYLAALWAAGQELEPALPVLPLTLPADHDGDGARSDHQPYWLSGRRGVMITDTANFRNPHYHRPTDTVDTLDFAFAEAVTRTVAAALRRL